MMDRSHHSSTATLQADTPALLSPRIAVSPPSDAQPPASSSSLAFQFPVANGGNNCGTPTAGWRRRLSRHRPRSSSVSRSTDALVQASALALTQPLSIDIQLSGPPPARASSASDLPCHASLLSPPPLYNNSAKRYAADGNSKNFKSACDLRFTGSGTALAVNKKQPSGGRKGCGLTVDLNKSDNDVTRAASVTSSDDSTGAMTSSSNDSSARQSSLESNGSPGPWPPPNPAQPPPSPGPRYSLLQEADVQVCCLNHARTVVSKVLSSRFLRRWETLRLTLNDAEIVAHDGSGILQRPLAYSAMQDVYTVNRWDATGRYCLRIVVPEGSVLLQAASSYTRDQWFHSILWKKNLHKYRSVLSQSRSADVILKELKCLVDFTATTPLQDDCIMNEPIAIVSELLDQPENVCSRASLLRTSAPLLEDAPASAPLCRHVVKHCLHPYDESDSDTSKESNNDSLSFSAVDRLVRRILKHGADYSTSPHARDLVRDYLAAIGAGVGGSERLAAFVDSVHGPGSACPHPRVLPNLASVCFSGITARYEEISNDATNSPAKTDLDGSLTITRNNSNTEISNGKLTKRGSDETIDIGNLVQNDIQPAAEELILKSRSLSDVSQGSNATRDLEDEHEENRKHNAQTFQSTEDLEEGKLKDTNESVDATEKLDENVEIKSVQEISNEVEKTIVILNQMNETQSSTDKSDCLEDTRMSSAETSSVELLNDLNKMLDKNHESDENFIISKDDKFDVSKETPKGESKDPNGICDKAPVYCKTNLAVKLDDNTAKVLNQTKQALIQSLRTQRLFNHSHKDYATGHPDEEDDTSNEDTASYRTCLDIEYGPDCEEISNAEESFEALDSKVAVFVTVLKYISNHGSWLPYLASLLQPLPFPAAALASPSFLDAMTAVVRRLAASGQCEVHRTLVGVRDSKKGWLDVYCPVSWPACPDGGKLWCRMLSTLLTCCGRRKRFMLQHVVPRRVRDLIRLSVQPWAGSARLALALAVEWDLLVQRKQQQQEGEEDELLQRAVAALMSTQRGSDAYAEACERRGALEKLRRTGGPRRLALPPRATDQDLADLLSEGCFGDLRSLCLAFTRVTGACAEHIIKLPSLRQLNLWSTQFDDAGLQLVAENLPQLRQLNLCETRVTDAGIASLASLKHLRTLNLNSTTLTSSTLQELRKKLPELQDCDVRYTEAW